MVIYRLMPASTWSALSDPNRRATIELLRQGPRPGGELVKALGITQPGTSKHPRVLREVGLVTVRQAAQRRVSGLAPKPLAELDARLAPYRRFWSERLDAL